MLRQILTLALCACSSHSAAYAFDARAVSTLKRLDPETRLIQACDLAAMNRINRDRNSYKPDRVMLDHLAPPVKKQDTVQGKGGVLRSRGDWYHLSFTCRASPDRLRVLSFSYEVGSKIPREDWDRLNLFP
jgi:hypothetical protein